MKIVYNIFCFIGCKIQVGKNFVKNNGNAFLETETIQGIEALTKKRKHYIKKQKREHFLCVSATLNGMMLITGVQSQDQN